ncbi:MAG TPA: choice-of-anchor J domain-containing protein, partial [Phycisphaerae bacterium]|nr:choice-of-anchor J domain-containing protein [Phycisphaerae bacterium]
MSRSYGTSGPRGYSWILVCIGWCGVFGTPAWAYDPLNGDYSKDNPLDVRIATYNVHGDFIADASRDAAFNRVLAAVAPDIIVFAEIPSDTVESQIPGRLDTVLPYGAGSWEVHGGIDTYGTRTVIASRFPLSLKRTDTIPASSTRGVTLALADLPDVDYPVDVYLLGVHLKCCGDPGGSEDDSRQASADAIANWLGDARGVSRPSGNNISLPADTPMVNLGDFNLVGGPQPENTLITGDIQDTSTYGPDVKGDWDVSDMTNLNPLDPFTGDNFTWQGSTSYDPSPLDRIIFTDSVAPVANSFILNTDTMTPAALAAAGLQAGDTLPENTSDHLPIAVDIRLVSSGCTTNGDCDDSLFCNGAETCDTNGVCQPGSDPCPGQLCNEVLDECGSCSGDPDCDDGNDCTVDTCAAGACFNDCPTTISSYPHTEDFEGGFGDWNNVGADDMDWTRLSGSTPSSSTGPSGDHTTGSGYYLYTEASNPNYPNKTALLVGPCLDLAGATDANLTFWYHMYGGGMGSLNVEVSANCIDWTSVFSASADHGDVWLEANVDLTAYVGSTVTIRFRGVTGSSYQSDMAIDDITVAVTSGCTGDPDCADGLYCNGVETCDTNGVCQPGTTVDCNDSVGCTDDSCNEGTDSCDNIPNNGLCDNSLYCDGTETCDPVSDCQPGTAVDCNDGVGCTDDSCNEGAGSCDNIPNNGLCDNGLYCDGAETCNPVSDCQPGTAVGCDDSVGCTDDSCNEGTDSCDNLPNDALCDNGLYCDGPETCDALLDCQVGTTVDCGDGVGCTDDSCNEDADSCDNIPNNGLCDNGLYCDGAETCDALLDCQAGTAVDCDDGVGCTDDSCNEGADSCDNIPNDSLCDNGLYCDGAETCDALLDCQAGTAVDCDDGVGCTDDSCNEGTDSCDNVPNDGLCDNGLYCDGAETCDPVSDCQAGTPVDCPDDGLFCTGDEFCDEEADACGHTGNPCDPPESCNEIAGTCGFGSVNIVSAETCYDHGAGCPDQCLPLECDTVSPYDNIEPRLQLAIPPIV